MACCIVLAGLAAAVLSCCNRIRRRAPSTVLRWRMPRDQSHEAP